jgi:uncharacterized protein (TIGR02611 family)
LILIIAIPVLIVGVILLAVPGPGVLVIFLGLLILSWEFDWAKRPLKSVRERLRKMSAHSKPKDDNV